MLNSRTKKQNSLTQKKDQRKRRSRQKFLRFFLALAGLCFIGYLAGFIKFPISRADLLNNDKITFENTAFKTYAVNNTTKQKLHGLQVLNDKTYYFTQENGQMVHGFHKINGYYYDFSFDGSDDVLTAYKAVEAKLKSKSPVIENTIAEGMKLVGKSPYVYGAGRKTASIKKNQFDCSSFVAWMYHLGGKDLVYQFAATTTLLSQTGNQVSWANKSRGDLLVTPDGAPANLQHVAIYLGGGFILHDATSTGGVAVSRLNQIIDKKVLGNETWAQLFETGSVQREVN